EVMLRFDPGFGRVRNARSFQVWEGGGEYNVARAMRKCWGKRATAVTALPINDLGWLVEDLMMQGGVDTSKIIWREFDGLGRVADQAGRGELGKDLWRRRRALVPHRRHLCRAGAEYLGGRDRGGGDRAQVPHYRLVRSELPRLALEE